MVSKLPVDLITRLRLLGPVLVLDSQSRDHPSSREIFLGGRPVAALTVHGSMCKIVHMDATSYMWQGSAWEALKYFREKFPGWSGGWLGYDLKNDTEALTSKNTYKMQLADLFWMQPSIFIKINIESGNINWVMGNEDMLPDLPENVPKEFHLENLEPGLDWEDYSKDIQSIQDYIKNGDVYEVNYTYPFWGDAQGDPLLLYESMREAGPVPFGAFIDTGRTAVCCASPERFLEKRGRTLRSQPIKGTVKRGETDQEDEKLIATELENEKNRAENLMIVDLVRNDLSKVCEPGSVQVDDLFEVQTFATLHQMVTSITGRITEECDPIDALKACFPMGSMTGAPKIRAMEIIEELEMIRRGVYSGAIGYITPDDDFDFNVVIRSAIVQNGLLQYQVGGAITSDSKATDEWEETWVKAQALMKAVEH